MGRNLKQYSYFLCRHYKYEQKLSSLFWKIDFKDIIMGDIDSAETDIKIKVRRFYFTFCKAHVPLFNADS